MPELPETETIARDLNASIAGRTIDSVSVAKSDVLREISKSQFIKRVSGKAIVRSWRRAKLVVTDLSSGDRIVVQPRFTGALIIDDGSIAKTQFAYSTMKLDLDDGRSLHYCDVRRLGTVALMDPKRFAAYTGELGIEPLDQKLH